MVNQVGLGRIGKSLYSVGSVHERKEDVVTDGSVSNLYIYLHRNGLLGNIIIGSMSREKEIQYFSAIAVQCCLSSAFNNRHDQENLDMNLKQTLRGTTFGMALQLTTHAN